MREWLQTKYQPAERDGPNAKKIKFEDVQNELCARFPSMEFNPPNVSSTIKEVFPLTFSKAAGKSRQKHIFGLEAIPKEHVESTEHLDLLVAKEREEKSKLLQKIEALEERIAQLEMVSLPSELDCLVNPSNVAYHGPDSISHFRAFNMDAIITEFTQQAPNVYHLLRSFGQCAQTSDEEHDVKVTMSMSILLKCRSVKVLGVQLLITLMLLARATNRQVKNMVLCYFICIYIMLCSSLSFRQSLY